ncbi:orotidine-5'-phosphate decarboxylase [Flexibacter flexilis DSM 6793]|uniref:Orotidine-5'-phosphate decarboxylase n=1 Tax=Flexibacter flexilis DSM 6793 TaxID=927664 RepID=A0A1I1K197_9BACT|nr:orotidine-5'-phosphate decarboxylase [Flexibacter flexilis]SFC52528.1 orotidine-5'-phosphate decarboxylase [Flexibacter flexilis DSM 6793]
MNRQQLAEQIRKKQSYLCVGLDTDITKIPAHLLSEPNPVLTFNRAIMEATADLCVAYKPNTAFYESLGSEGWQTLEQTLAAVPQDILTIADAKRGDIGNTSAMYARAFFEQMNVDAVTVAPYMGADSVKPFLGFRDKWAIVLALTSNAGSADFQTLNLEKEQTRLYETVIQKCMLWASADELMFVVGATQAAQIAHIRSLAPDYFFLVPGVGAQGGDLEEVSRLGFNQSVGLLVNASRSILYASSGKDFAEKARAEAKRLQQQMQDCLEKYL